MAPSLGLAMTWQMRTLSLPVWLMRGGAANSVHSLRKLLVLRFLSSCKTGWIVTTLFGFVRLWTAVVAYVERKATAGTLTWSLLHKLFTTKNDFGVHGVHAHLAILLSVWDRFVRSDPSFVFRDKLMVAAILMSIPTAALAASSKRSILS